MCGAEPQGWFLGVPRETPAMRAPRQRAEPGDALEPHAAAAARAVRARAARRSSSEQRVELRAKLRIQRMVDEPPVQRLALAQDTLELESEPLRNRAAPVVAG